MSPIQTSMRCKYNVFLNSNRCSTHADTYSRHWQSKQSYKLGKIVQICEMFACTTWPCRSWRGMRLIYDWRVSQKRKGTLNGNNFLVIFPFDILSNTWKVYSFYIKGILVKYWNKLAFTKTDTPTLGDATDLIYIPYGSYLHVFNEIDL
jgi:hypothetical protein